jgi:hypothetical protein
MISSALVAPAEASPELRPLKGSQDDGVAVADAFGKAIGDALGKAVRPRGPGADRSEQADGEPDEAPPVGEAATLLDASLPQDLSSVSPTPEAVAAVTPPLVARGNPVAQLLALIALDGFAAAPPSPASVETGETSGTSGALPPTDSRGQMSPALPQANASAPPSIEGAVGEPLPVAVVAAASYPPPAPPVPAQIAAALGGELATVASAASTPGDAGRAQPAARLITVALDPPELGALLVRLRLTGRGLEVAIAAQPQSVAAVREGLADIAQALHRHGIAVEALNVRVAEWRELAAAVAAAPRADAAAPAATGQSAPPQAGGYEQAFDGRGTGESFGNRRGGPAEGDGQRPRGGSGRREGDDGERETLGRVGAGDGRYV